MTPQDALSALQPAEAAHTCSTVARHQAAFVRTLLDEMDRYAGCRVVTEGLHEQLEDAGRRLAGLLARSA